MSKNILEKENFNFLKKNLLTKEKILFFLDYDGTLANFHKNPKKAIMSPETKKIIKKLNELNKIDIFMISGRQLDDLKEMVKINNINYAGLHGLEMPDFKLDKLSKKDIQNYIKKIQKKYKYEIDKNALYIENKKYVLSIHYRKNFSNKKELNNFCEEIINKDKYEIIEGRKIIEIRPKNWNKGKAVNLIKKKRYQNINYFDIYIGDDTTDEDAFPYIEGLSIYVKNNEKMSNKTDYYLNNPKEVLKFLIEIYQYLK
ncbi:MAG: trehalose-phosphatase [Bacillota bacterium]